MASLVVSLRAQLEDAGRRKIYAQSIMRHDKKNGQRYAQDVDVVFENVKIKTSKK